jgi:hypothetical protein
MNQEQAQITRKKLLYLEGIIAWETREYIWKVVIAPAGKEEIKHFAALVDPAKPFDPKKLAQMCSGELSVYFFLKRDGEISYMEYEEFLYLNNIRINADGHAPKAARHPS